VFKLLGLHLSIDIRGLDVMSVVVLLNLSEKRK